MATSNNPRKFSEKIALHNQKQAEETAAFEEVMKDLSLTRAARVSTGEGRGGGRGGGRDAGAGLRPPQVFPRRQPVRSGCSRGCSLDWTGGPITAT